MDRLLTAPTTTYVDSDGRFWRNIPGLSSVVYRIDAQPGNHLVRTLTDATATYHLVQLEG